MKNLDYVEIVMELEGGNLVIEDLEDWDRLKGVVASLSESMGFYGRLLERMEDYDEDELEFPIYM